MYCPKCRAEYRQGFTRCTDCDADLVDSPPLGSEVELREEGFTDPLARLWMDTDPVLYSALTAALSDAQIPFFDNPPADFDNWLSSPTHNILSVGIPHFDIRVPESRLEAAKDILQSLLGQAAPDPIE